MILIDTIFARNEKFYENKDITNNVEMNTIEEIHKVPKAEKIKILESVSQTDVKLVIDKIVSLLDHPDIEIRGEAFSALVLNKNDISEILIQNLNSTQKNIRAYSALILGNRKDLNAIEPLIKLVSDKRSSVRSCALGALGYLKADGAKQVIRRCLADEDMEVKKSALKAMIDIGDDISTDELKELSNQNDAELNKLIKIAMKTV